MFPVSVGTVRTVRTVRTVAYSARAVLLQSITFFKILFCAGLVVRHLFCSTHTLTDAHVVLPHFISNGARAPL